MSKMLAVAALAAFALTAALSSANAGRGGCDEFGCGTNGTTFNGAQPDGIVLSDESPWPTVSRFVLPSGEIVEAR